MRFQFAPVAITSLVVFLLPGCGGTTPPPLQVAEPVEKPKVIELKDFDGRWHLKSSLLISEGGIYPTNIGDGGEVYLQIRDGMTEMRKGNGPWVKYATIALGSEPQSLLMTKSDASGQQRIVHLRYKLEGNTLITVHDNLYPDILPDSFDMNSGIERQRQTNTYSKIVIETNQSPATSTNKAQ